MSSFDRTQQHLITRAAAMAGWLARSYINRSPCGEAAMRELAAQMGQVDG